MRKNKKNKKNKKSDATSTEKEIKNLVIKNRLRNLTIGF